MTHYNKHVFLCTNKKSSGKRCCADIGGDTYFAYLKDRLMDLGLHGPGKIRVSKSGCLGRCSSGPCIVIYPESTWYTYSSFADIDKIIETDLIQNDILESHLINH